SNNFHLKKLKIMNVKRNSIKIVSLVVLMLLQINFSFAQRGHRGHGPSLEQLSAELDLTVTQQEQLKTIQEKYATQREALRDQHEGDREALRSAAKELRAAQKADVEQVLTTEQLTKLKALREARQQEHRAHRAERKATWDKVDKEAMKAELETYRDENIAPVMSAQRAKLEPKIDNTDKTTIASLRQEMKAFKNEHKAKRKAHREGATPADRERMRAAKKTMHEAMQDKKAAIKALVEKYDADLTALLAEIKPQQQQWKADMKAIRDKYVPAELRKKHDGEEESPGRHPKHRGKHRKGKKGNGGHKAGAMKAKFLLMESTGNTDATREALISNVQVFPSPAVDNNTLSYELKTAGRIRVDLVDQQGNVVQTVVDAFREAGTYTEQVNFDRQTGKNLFYRLIDPEGQVVTKQFIVTQE
ncbi:MAG: hypothetical protein AAFO94_00425, partial [Bacteroidota bacterium]